jgi:hypothetical protein
MLQITVSVWPMSAVMGWSWGLVMLWYFALLLKLSKMENFRLAELREVGIQFWDFLQPFSDHVAMQWSGMQHFYGLDDDLIIWYF